MHLTVEVLDPFGMDAEVEWAIASGEPARLEMPGWGSAPEVKIIAAVAISPDRPRIDWREVESHGVTFLIGGVIMGDRVFEFRAPMRDRDGERERLQRYVSRRIGAAIGEWMATDD